MTKKQQLKHLVEEMKQHPSLFQLMWHQYETLNEYMEETGSTWDDMLLELETSLLEAESAPDGELGGEGEEEQGNPFEQGSGRIVPLTWGIFGDGQ